MWRQISRLQIYTTDDSRKSMVVFAEVGFCSDQSVACGTDDVQTSVRCCVVSRSSVGEIGASKT